MTRSDGRKCLGDKGEEAAAAYLTRCGFDVLARKWRCAAGEIDLIVRQGALLAFVEVRTRRSVEPGMAAESITAAKRARLVALAEAFLAWSDLPEETPWRIDVVAIAARSDGTIASIEHIPYAVEHV